MMQPHIYRLQIEHMHLLNEDTNSRLQHCLHTNLFQDVWSYLFLLFYSSDYTNTIVYELMLCDVC